MKKLVLLFLMLSGIKAVAQLTDVITALDDPTSIAISGDELYIAERHKVIKINLNDANPIPEDVLTGISNGAYLLLNGNDLYIALFAGAKIVKIDLSVANPTPVDVVTGVFGSNGLAIQGNYLYIAESTADKISRVDLTESNPIASDFITGLDFPNGLLIDGNELFFIEVDDDKISKVDLSEINPSPVDVIANLNTPSMGLVFIEDDLYFSQFGGDKISKINTNDSTPIVMDVITDLDGPAQLLLEGDELFIAVSNENRIVKIENASLSVQDIDPNELKESKLAIYPNPALNSISIHGLQHVEMASLFTTEGKKIRDFTAYEGLTLDLQHLDAGIYYLVFENGRIQKVLKL